VTCQLSQLTSKVPKKTADFSSWTSLITPSALAFVPLPLVAKELVQIADWIKPLGVEWW
jgi:hypothetical protein